MENPLYAKIFKWISWALLLISAGLTIWAFTRFNVSRDAESGAVEAMLRWTYIMVAIALIAVLVIGIYITATTSPKSLVSLGIILAGAVVVCLIAYLLAPGSPAVGFNGTTPPTDAELKLTDTVLNLTYFLCGATILAIIVGECFSWIRSKKA